jgi:hypothetical protein
MPTAPKTIRAILAEFREDSLNNRDTRYMVDLVKRVVRVGLGPTRLVGALPRLNERIA